MPQPRPPGYWAAYRARNRDRRLAQEAAFRERNRDHFNAYHRASNGRYRATKRAACPSWVSDADLQPIYAEAVRLTTETGVVHHVDHIIPLQHPLVCGLHVPWNLKPIPAADNIAKSNQFTPGLA